MTSVPFVHFPYGVNLGNMIYLMFLILCFLIIACRHREPKKLDIWEEIANENAREKLREQAGHKSVYEILREYGKK